MIRTGKLRKLQQIPKSHRLLFEHLERRTLLHGASAAMVGNVLEITGTDNADTVDLVANRDSGTIDLVVPGHSIQSFSADSIASVRILGLGGDDLVTLDRGLNLPTYIDGGEGIDTVLGWSGPDPLHSSSSPDEFNGFACVGVECFTLPNDDNESSTLEPRIDGVTALATSESVLPSAHTQHGLTTSSTIAHVPTSHLGITISHDSSGISSALDHSVGISSFSDGVAATSHHAADGIAGMSVAIGAATTIGIAGMESFSDKAISAENYEFSLRSPYAGKECPTSAPLGATTLTNTLAGPEMTTGATAPKVGCG
jgi:hypothetical protein